MAVAAMGKNMHEFLGDCFDCLHVQVDPSLIGGIIIDVGDKHIDLSISSQVKRLQQLMLETV